MTHSDKLHYNDINIIIRIYKGYDDCHILYQYVPLSKPKDIKHKEAIASLKHHLINDTIISNLVYILNHLALRGTLPKILSWSYSFYLISSCDTYILSCDTYILSWWQYYLRGSDDYMYSIYEWTSRKIINVRSSNNNIMITIFWAMTLILILSWQYRHRQYYPRGYDYYMYTRTCMYLQENK